MLPHPPQRPSRASSTSNAGRLGLEGRKVRLLARADGATAATTATTATTTATTAPLGSLETMGRSVRVHIATLSPGASTRGGRAAELCRDSGAAFDMLGRRALGSASCGGAARACARRGQRLARRGASAARARVAATCGSGASERSTTRCNAFDRPACCTPQNRRHRPGHMATPQPATGPWAAQRLVPSTWRNQAPREQATKRPGR